MKDNFDIKKFLVENKLGAYSRLKEIDEAKETEEAFGGINETEALNEYQVTYYWEGYDCFSVDDENNVTKLNSTMPCKRYAQNKMGDEGLNERDTEKVDEVNKADLTYNFSHTVSDEAYRRMDGLVSQPEYQKFISSATNIMNDLTYEGFDTKDIYYYLFTRLTADV